MNVLYYLHEYQTVMSQWQRWHIIDELGRHGVNVEIVNPLAFDSVAAANEGILERLSANKYDLFMTPFNEEDLYIDTLKQIKAIGIPTLLICFDNLKIPFFHKNIAPLFDLVWLTSVETEYLFKRWGANTIFLPYAANPYYLQAAPVTDEIERVGFIGTPHGSRINRINLLIQNGIPTTVHTKTTNVSQSLMEASAQSYAKAIADDLKYKIGRKLALGALKNKFSHRSLEVSNPNLSVCDVIPFEELAAANARYALQLSFTEANSTGLLKNPVDIVNLRNFEIPMSGGIQFARYSPELASYYEDGKEIVLYRSEEEMIDKARFYLRPDQAENRAQIRRAARARSESEHTWYCRFTKVFDRLGLQYEGNC